jgi:hypothetical protein
MLKNGKNKMNWLEIIILYSSAYEIWGSPEMLNKEKAKRVKTRQEEYEGIVKNDRFFKILISLLLDIFGLKKSVKQYQKRLSMLENASFDNRKSVKLNLSFIKRWLFFFRLKEIFLQLVVEKSSLLQFLCEILLKLLCVMTDPFFYTKKVSWKVEIKQ